ncbi:hypothetical protein Q1J61_10275, partial [Pseudomonas putida]|uniref:hypothetical protein n=1 Tax=Pseudomonas putida TaxID=303 RepID=UPI0034D68E00
GAPLIMAVLAQIRHAAVALTVLGSSPTAVLGSKMAGAAARPIAGKPAPTGTAPVSKFARSL